MSQIYNYMLLCSDEEPREYLAGINARLPPDQNSYFARVCDYDWGERCLLANVRLALMVTRQLDDTEVRAAVQGYTWEVPEEVRIVRIDDNGIHIEVYDNKLTLGQDMSFFREPSTPTTVRYWNDWED